MKMPILKTLCLSLLLFMSCKKDYALQVNSSNYNNSQSKEITNANQPKSGYQYFEAFDQTVNMKSTRIQLPLGWKQGNSGNYAFIGPNNMKIGKVQMSRMHAYTEDYNMLQTYQMSRIKNERPLTINQIVDTYFMPYANQNNMRLIRTFPLPKIAQKAKQFLELNFTSTPTQINVEGVGLEWEDNKGMTYLTILRKMTFSTYNQLQWGFINQHIESPNTYYNKAKTIFIEATLSEQHNTDWLFKKNQIAAQRANQSWQAHKARMDALKLNSTNSSFTSSTTSSNVGNIYSDILDINHSGYLKRSNMTSHGQAKTIRGIRNTTIISNHNTGEHYTVPAGSKYYWVNNNGRHFGTNNPNYDPRTDNRINQTEWSQFQVEN